MRIRDPAPGFFADQAPRLEKFDEDFSSQRFGEKAKFTELVPVTGTNN